MPLIRWFTVPSPALISDIALLAFAQIGPFELVVVWIGFLAPVLIAIDSFLKRIPFLRETYDTADPVRWFFFTFFLWCVVVPFYVYHRHQVLRRRRESEADESED